MLTLYDFPTSGNCYKVRLLLAHLGIPYRRVHRDILKGETRLAEHLAVNPAGKVPVLETEDGVRYVESGAILWHFARGTRLFPVGAEEETRTLQWLLFEQSALAIPLGRPRYFIKILGKGEEFKDDIAKLMPLGRLALERVETHLADGNPPFFVGRRFSIADIALYAYTHLAPEGGYDLSTYPATRAWFERVRSEPGHISITDR